MVDRARLESGSTFTGTGSSNLPLSASDQNYSFPGCPPPAASVSQLAADYRTNQLLIRQPLCEDARADDFCRGPLTPRIIFDTSALNGLAEDVASPALVAGISVGYHVLLSETNINEIAATTAAEKREDLLKLCQRLVREGESHPAISLDSKRSGKPPLDRSEVL